MPFVDTPNVVMAEIVAVMDGQVIENRVMVDVFHEPTSVDLGNVTTAVLSFVNLRYVQLLPVECVITSIKTTSLDARNRIQQIAAVSIPGEVTGGAMPNEVTYCVSLKSTQIGRSGRGRFYVLGIAKANVSTQNRVGAGYRANITAALDFLRDALTDMLYRLVIVSYVTNGAPRPGGPIYNIVANAATSDDVVDSQRRRRPGVGT